LVINNGERPLGASHRRRDDPLRGINAATHPNAEQALSFRSCEGQRSCLPNYSFIMNRVRISPKRNPYIAYPFQANHWHRAARKPPFGNPDSLWPKNALDKPPFRTTFQ
jgi:hypothetical protein